MNALKPFVAALVGLSMHQALANNHYDNYRLGFYPEAAVELRNHAGNDATADYYLGQMSLYGYGLLRKPESAMRHFAKAASKGNHQAQFLMARIALHEKNYPQAYHWFKKLADAGDMDAKLYVAAAWNFGLGVKQNEGMARGIIIDAAKDGQSVGMYALGVHFVDSRYSRNHRLGMIWLEKAAKAGNPMAMIKLADCYERGRGTRKNPAEAKVWLAKARALNDQAAKEWVVQTQDEAAKQQLKPEQEAALWLSMGQSATLQMKPYKLDGILLGWNNPLPMRDDIYNQYPETQGFSRQELFQPEFKFVSPNDVPVADYYQALVKATPDLQENQWTYPSYPFHPMLETINQGGSYALRHHDFNGPYRNAYASDADENPLMASFMPSAQKWQQEGAFLLVFNDLYQRALLGDPSAQFEVGQMFEHGLGVMKSPFQAVLYYEKAAAQNHIGAEYNLGIMYLKKDQYNADNRQKAMNWLKDAAFKGNRYAQYVLSRELSREHGHFAKAQAESMLYLSAANGFGEAQYQLAERLIREPINDVRVAQLKKRSDFILSLYRSAARQGVAQALVPLAFYDAMSTDEAKRSHAFKVAKKQAEAGDEQAALLLGMMYDRGLGTQVNRDRALHWYQQSGNNAVSDFILGTYTVRGERLAKDITKGIYLLEQASRQQFSWADYNLAIVSHQQGRSFLARLIAAYNEGNNHAGLLLADYYLAAHQDADAMRQALSIYNRLAEKGDARGQMKLAYMYSHGIGVNVNEAQARHWYTSAARQGDTLAQFQLARFYQIGVSGKPDDKKAVYWYQQAADKLPRAANSLGFIYETVFDDYQAADASYQQGMQAGDMLAAYNLGLIYEYGKSTAVDYAKARDIYSKAAKGGVAAAMYRLAEMNFHGYGQKQDLAKAVQWYQQAADRGVAAAQYQLGLMHETGVGVKIDDALALKYYQSASNALYQPAMLAMARMYQYGLGVAKNISTAAALYQKLASYDNHYAQYQLALLHLDGVIDEHSPAKGKALLQAASKNGNQQSQQMLHYLAAQNGTSSSYLEPVMMNQASALSADMDANRLFLDAMSEWNRGDAVMSRMILHRLISQYPNYLPAKRAFEQLNQSSLSNVYSFHHWTHARHWA